MKIVAVTRASSGMGREVTIQLWEHFESFDEIWIIIRRGERLDELGRQAGMPLRRFTLDPTGERDRGVLLWVLSARKPQVKSLANATGFGMIRQVEELGLKSETDMVALDCEALCAVARMVLLYMEYNSRIIQYASSAAFLPQPGFAIYAATELFVLSCSRALDQGLRDRRIYVTAICPGPVKIEFFDIAGPAGVVPLYKRLVMANPERVVQEAVQDNIAGREISVYSTTMKAFQLLYEMVPYHLLLTTMSLMND